ncbi:MAG: hypothetical protein M1828_000838 [Chrysothrix sp. TS-e1954]|nr:MAG: hypothetical protein M1828_000838 [Chrysothrix sp. TS-e1954]
MPNTAAAQQVHYLEFQAAKTSMARQNPIPRTYSLDVENWMQTIDINLQGQVTRMYQLSTPPLAYIKAYQSTRPRIPLSPHLKAHQSVRTFDYSIGLSLSFRSTRPQIPLSPNLKAYQSARTFDYSISLSSSQSQQYVRSLSLQLSSSLSRIHRTSMVSLMELMINDKVEVTQAAAR